VSVGSRRRRTCSNARRTSLGLSTGSSSTRWIGSAGIAIVPFPNVGETAMPRFFVSAKEAEHGFGTGKAPSYLAHEDDAGSILAGRHP
jgi:hypothetical protein